MSPAHLLLALAVVVVWGTNFVIIKLGLGELPPLLFAALRFFFSCVPWVFLIRRPPVAWKLLAANGVFLGFGLFGLLFIAMRADITPGIASLVVQTQAFFTIGLSMLLLSERLRAFQAAGLALCVAGLGILFAHTDASLTTRGLILTLAGGLSWAIANLVAKRAGKVDMLGFMVWSSLFAVPPLLIASLVFEGPERIAQALVHADWLGWSASIWQGVANTLFGYGAWNWLLARYPAATVSPLSLLVPVFGMLTATVAFAEPLPAWKLQACALLLLGLAVITLWPRLRARLLEGALPSGGSGRD
ncbi:EamA family transporter [Luteimonas aquatica]|uniref:EamA family transporter n=1 Tax=Luteimonas aquatica TaxID=450364 RepID=UPI001F58D750|nr:EamA family transporter [Luteimonas aquatica]